ncbi:hypothetical protein [Marivita sp.]|uniref:hypothetical protein n=1 Tax=Marivita sp. TaxID=2003365 RepID=UPI003F6A8DCB
MTQNTTQNSARSRLLPVTIIVLSVGLVGIAIWQIGPSPYSQTNPYLDDPSQSPTGAGSNPDGTAAVVEDQFPIERDADRIIDGSSDANDLTGITRTQPENTVADEGRRTLDPSDVVTPDSGTVSNETGTVQPPQES